MILPLLVQSLEFESVISINYSRPFLTTFRNRKADFCGASSTADRQLVEATSEIFYIEALRFFDLLIYSFSLSVVIYFANRSFIIIFTFYDRKSLRYIAPSDLLMISNYSTAVKLSILLSVLGVPLSLSMSGFTAVLLNARIPTKFITYREFVFRTWDVFYVMYRI